MIRSTHTLAPLWAATLVLAGCRSSLEKETIPPRFSVEEVPAAIEASRQELLSGDRAEEALERMRSAKNTPALPAELRHEVQNVIELAAEQLIEQLENPKRLKALIDIDLPRRLAVEAGMRAAHLYYERGDRMKSFRLIRSLDAKFPQHHQRREAGALLAEIGFDLADDHRRYGLFFHYHGLAPQVLEYLVLNYPSDPNGDRALWTLGGIYESKRNWEVAIEKHEDLILWFSESPRAAASEARIPYLRLASVRSPEHDRAQIERARAELERWLSDHPAHPLEEEVLIDLTDAMRRLADNDLVVARFYRTVKNFPGAEYHSRRALQEARDGGDTLQIEEAQNLLAEVAAWGSEQEEQQP